MDLGKDWKSRKKQSQIADKIVIGRQPDCCQMLGSWLSPQGPSKIRPNQKNSRRLELSSSKNTPYGMWGQGACGVDPRFPAGLPFPVPEILEFVAFRDSGYFCPAIFLGLSRSFPRKPPEQTAETATAFSSFLTKHASTKIHPKIPFKKLSKSVVL